MQSIFNSIKVSSELTDLFAGIRNISDDMVVKAVVAVMGELILGNGGKG